MQDGKKTKHTKNMKGNEIGNEKQNVIQPHYLLLQNYKIYLCFSIINGANVYTTHYNEYYVHTHYPNRISPA